MGDLFSLADQETRLLRLVRRRDNWSEGYLWQPEGRGGVIRLVPDPFLRWMASQKPHEKAVRERLKGELGNDLSGAVSALARRYPDGIPVHAAEVVSRSAAGRGRNCTGAFWVGDSAAVRGECGFNCKLTSNRSYRQDNGFRSVRGNRKCNGERWRGEY